MRRGAPASPPPERGGFATKALLDQARDVLPALPAKPAYARVDGFVREGALHLMEVELIEPYLFLEHGGQEATRRFCEAITAQIRS